MRLVLDHGAEPSTGNDERTTPLLVAAGIGYIEGQILASEEKAFDAVRMLVERGEDVNTTNDKNETALHGAAYRGANSIALYLIDRGARLDIADELGTYAGHDCGRCRRRPLLPRTRRDRGAVARADGSERPAEAHHAGCTVTALAARGDEHAVVMVEVRGRREAAFMNCAPSGAWMAVSACAVLFLSACGTEPSAAAPQGSNTHAPVPSVEWPYSFVQEPFVHPQVVGDLSTWSSDVGDQVVAINLLDAQGSNRYSASIGVTEIDERCPYVYWEPAEEPGEFGYRYVSMTESRVHVLLTSSWGGGSGVFKMLMLLTITSDTGIEWNGQAVIQDDRERLLVNKLGEFGLGDRWDGELRVAGNTLTIGRDRGWFSVSGGTGGRGADYERTLTINVRRSGGLDFGAREYACAAVSGAKP